MSFYLRMDGQKQIVLLDTCPQCARKDSANTVFEVMEHGGVHCRGCGKLHPLDDLTKDLILHPETYLTQGERIERLRVQYTARVRVPADAEADAMAMRALQQQAYDLVKEAGFQPLFGHLQKRDEHGVLWITVDGGSKS